MKGKLTIILVWFLSLLHVLVSAQTYYFNNRYELTPYHSWDFASTIIQKPEKYVIYGESGGNFGWRTIVLKQLDLNGIEVETTIIGDTLSEWSIGYPGSLLKSPHGTYFSTGFHRNYTTNWVHDRGLLIKFDENYDTLWTREYGEKASPFDTSYILRNICFSGSKDIVMTGSWGVYSTGIMNPKVYLLKTDTSGNKLWEHVYTNLPGDVQGYSVISTTDGGYAIGAFQYYHVPPSDETGDPLVIKTDSLGNFEWVKNLGGEFSDSHDMLALSTDGNILAYCTYAVLNNPGSDSYKSPQVTKLENNGSIIWEKRYLKPKHFTYPGNLHVDNDGSIILCGKTMISYPRNTGWMMKLSSEGDSLWYRQFDLMTGSESEHMLYDVIPTNDNGYIACGYVNPVLPDTGTQDVWVVKVDSLGCENLNFCWVSVKELPVVPKWGELITFPSPAEQAFTVQFQELIKKSTIQFVDVMGRKVEEIHIAPFASTESVNCSHWPPGIYFAQLLSDGKVVAKGKLLVK
jgi:hypothetical protein